MPAPRCLVSRPRRQPRPRPRPRPSPPPLAAVLMVAAAAASFVVPCRSCCRAFVLVPPPPPNHHPPHVMVPLRASPSSRPPTPTIGGGVYSRWSYSSAATAPVEDVGDDGDGGDQPPPPPSTTVSRRDALAAATTAAVVATTWTTRPNLAAAAATTNMLARTAVVVGDDVDLSAAVQRLWDLDVNRLRPGRDYVIDVQGGKNAYQVGLDVAPGPLFVARGGVNPAVFRERETYQTFVALLNNYNAQTCTSEQMTEEKLFECRRFVRSVMSTPVMRFCYQYCRGRVPDKVPEDYYGERGTFEKLLYDIWFKLYRRCDLEERPMVEGGGDATPTPPMAPDSSGFEHVFVGEVKDGKVIGFHNWIQFYLQERMGNVDYRGYIKPRRRTRVDADGNVVADDSSSLLLPANDDQVLTMQFAWNGVEKPVGTSFIGVSPEFELALYTMLFFTGKQENLVTLDTGTGRFDLDAKCFKIARGRRVGSCFVESRAHRAGR